MSAVNDGRCSPWVMCSCSVVSGNQIRGTGGGNGGPGPCGANETAET